MSVLPKSLSGTWHVFGRGSSWVASSNGHNNETIAEVFGFSPEDREARARAISAAPDLLQALMDLIELVEMDEDASDPATDLYVSLKLAKLAVGKAEGGA